MSNLLVSLYKAFTVRKRVHWVQRHIANNDLNIMPFQMSLNVRLTVVVIQLFDIQSTLLQFARLLQS